MRNLSVRDVLREKGTPFHELSLGNPALTDDELLDAIEAHPVLLNRPLVVTPKGVNLCRPSEVVFARRRRPVEIQEVVFAGRQLREWDNLCGPATIAAAIDGKSSIVAIPACRTAWMS